MRNFYDNDALWSAVLRGNRDSCKKTWPIISQALTSPDTETMIDNRSGRHEKEERKKKKNTVGVRRVRRVAKSRLMISWSSDLITSRVYVDNTFNVKTKNTSRRDSSPLNLTNNCHKSIFSGQWALSWLNITYSPTFGLNAMLQLQTYAE